jgi:hypothetical protein
MNQLVLCRRNSLTHRMARSCHSRASGNPDFSSISWIPGRASYRQLARNDVGIVSTNLRDSILAQHFIDSLPVGTTVKDTLHFTEFFEIRYYQMLRSCFSR